MRRALVLQDVVSILLWIITFQLLAVLSSKFSVPGAWYHNLVKSPLTPPGYVFAFVWPVLYTMLAIFGFCVWQLYDFKSDQGRVQSIFIIQMLINYAWSPVFFAFGQVKLACIMIAVMFLLTAYTIYKCIKYRYIIGYLLIPYCCWTLFAGYLTGYILLSNAGYLF